MTQKSKKLKTFKIKTSRSEERNFRIQEKVERIFMFVSSAEFMVLKWCIAKNNI